ncbi:hypothetical protein KAR48_03675 [bacterium]|nr:hypothetical protein [bacterium]
MQIKTIFPILLLSLLYMPVLTAQDISQRYGGDLNYAENIEPHTLNPYERVKPTDVTDHLYAMFYERLVRYDFYKNKTFAVLAQSWEVSSDNKSIIFYLRKNVRWHDGMLFTAHDIKFTYDYIKARAQHRSVNTYKSKSLGFIDEVIFVDDYTIQFTFTESQTDAANQFDFWIIPRHRFTSQFLPKTDKSGRLSVFPIGTGPYCFFKQTLDKNISIKVNKNYWGDKGHIERIRMWHVPDQTTMINRLLMGGVKLILETPPRELARVHNSGDYKTQAYDSFRIHALAYNNRNPILKNKLVRQAMTFATNRPRLLKEWYADKGEVLFGPVVDAHPYFNDNLTPRPNNLNETRRLLDAANLKDNDGDGIREDVSSQKALTFELVYPVSSVATETATQSIIESYATWMKEIGIKIIQRPMVMDKYLDRLFKAHEFDIAFIEWTFDSSYDITSLFHSKETEPGDDNFINYSNIRVDQLITEYSSSADKEVRRACMNSIQEVLYEDCPYTFLYNVDNYASIHFSINNAVIDPYYFFTFLPQWYIPEEFQF